MAVIVALASVKGGVGKTATAVNLAALAAAGGRRVLLWDLDPQGAATYTLGVGRRAPGGALRLARKRPGTASAVTPTAWAGLDLIPADFSLRHLDLELADLGKPRKQLAKALMPVTGDYDLVFIDCPPGITLTIESVLRATDVVLVPVVPAVLPLRAFDQLASYVRADRKVGKLDTVAFLTMVDRRKKAHREMAERLPAERDDVLSTTVPASVQVETMALHRRPLASSAPRSAAAQAYSRLWDELATRIPAIWA
jgi:chromosome partitioning protein